MLPDPRTPSPPEISVVIPTYRGANTLASLLGSLREVLHERGVRFELIVVSDASPDDTWDVLSRLAPEMPELVAVDLLTNHGQPKATMCGMSQAGGAVVVTMDDDLQHPPDQLPLLLDALDAHPDWDAAVGSWPRDQSGVRNLGSRVHGLLDRLAHGTPAGFQHTAFRAMRRPTVDALVADQTALPLVGPMLTRAASQVHNVEVRHDPRGAGGSTFGYLRAVSNVTGNFVKGSTLPLQLVSALGFASAAVAALVGSVFALRWLFGVQTPPGWLSAFLSATFFGGTTLFTLGLIGLYLRVIVAEVHGAPRWSVRRTLPAQGPSPHPGRS